MRSLLLVVFLLLLSVLIHDVQGRRLPREGSVLADDGKHTLHKEEFPVMKSSSTDEERESKKWSSAGKRKRKLSRERKETHHWLPRIHEDYYGPRMHRPKHH